MKKSSAPGLQATDLRGRTHNRVGGEGAVPSKAHGTEEKVSAPILRVNLCGF